MSHIAKSKWAVVTLISVFTVMAFAAPALAQDPDVKKALEIQKALKDLINKVKPAFVFFGRGGSSVCISPDGYVITNNHVATKCRRSKSIFKDFYFTGGKRYSGKIIWYDPAGDIALCKLDLAEGETVPFVKLGSSDDLKVGEQAIAIGNPFSLGLKSWDPTVTFGVISAVRRYKGWYSEAVQTDAAINPGNSGGPLFNMKGEVVGINGLIEIDGKRGRVNVGVGYAVPSTQIARFIKHYKGKFTKGGEVVHGGIKGLNIDLVPLGRQGAMVKTITKDSSAEKAGFKTGDVITIIGGKPVVHPRHVPASLHTYPKGFELVVTVDRGGELVDITVTLDATSIKGRRTMSRPRRPGRPGKPTPGTPRTGGAFFGVGTEAVEGGGLKILQVVPDSGADKSGLKMDDIIIKVSGREFSSPDSFGSFVRGHKPGARLKIVFLRDGKEMETTVILGKRS